MNISLLENGLHSLNKGYLTIKEYELCKDEKLAYFLLKDAILSIHHGVEILMKECLRRKNEFLIFSNIDKHVKDTYKEKRQKNLKDIFMTTKIKSVHMITYDETIDRMEAFYEIDLKRELKDSLIKLNKYRNIITHSGICLDQLEILETIYCLAHSLDFYFEKILTNEYNISRGYINLKKSIESLEEYSNNIKLYKCIVDILKKEEINVGLGEVIYITDINKAFNFLTGFHKEKFVLGADVINGFCSGSITKITRNKTELNIYTNDNGSIYNFKFKGILIAIPPNLESNESPLIFLESLSNEKPDIDKNFIETLLKEKRYIHELKITSENLSLYGNDYDYKNEWVGKTQDIYYFLDETILIFFNIQGFNYQVGSHLLKKVTNQNLETIKETILNYYKNN
ncbi:hypothetical protein [Cetobacterium sp.]|uniref:hypothetical protein n=1 Tax=Cetobacterium sp. TaxID=2071632 RepID=UPI003F41AAF6